VWHLDVARAGEYQFELRRWPRERAAPLADGPPARKVTDGEFPAGAKLPIASSRLRIAGADRTQKAAAGAESVTFRVPLSAGPTELQTWFFDADGRELCGAYYVYVHCLDTESRRTFLRSAR
jgi:hypothetical protein